MRNIARISASGPMIRLRFFNLDEAAPIVIGRAFVGLRDGGVDANLVPGTNRPVTFGCGKTSVTIPPGTTSLYSDPIQMDVRSQDDLAISLYVQGSGNAAEFSALWSESYETAADAGDLTDVDSGDDFSLIGGSDQVPPGTPLVCNGCVAYALRDVEVLTQDAHGALVFLGSSSFHGFNTTQNAFIRVSDLISERMDQELPRGERLTIVNRGIGGDTLLNAFNTRMEQDVWSTVGVKGVVAWVTNDLSSRNADQIIETYLALIAEAHARNINVFCPTWVPGAQSGASNVNGERDKLNDWILNSGNCDGIVDYGTAVENPLVPGTYSPLYVTDGIHTNDAGQALWAEMTPLAEWAAAPPPD